MSNTRRPKWTAEQITAANAEALLIELGGVIGGEASPKTRAMMLEVWDRLDAEERADEFPGLADKFRADAAREVITRKLLGDLEADGRGPEVLALVREKLAALDDEFWAGIYQRITS